MKYISESRCKFTLAFISHSGGNFRNRFIFLQQHIRCQFHTVFFHVRSDGHFIVILKSCEAFQEEQTVEVKKWLRALYLIHFGRVT